MSTTSDDVLAVPGTITTSDSLDLPAGSVATVKLVDNSGEVLAATTLAADALPLAFTLHADPADVANPNKLFLWGRLRSAAGVWGTVELQKIRGDETELVLTRVGD